MPLVGGGGAGNVAGSNPASSGEGLNYIGDHAYGYSGVLDIDGTETSMLEFTTGSSYFVGTVQFNYVELNGYHFQYRFYLNDVIMQGFIDPSGTSGDPTASTSIIPIIIPPFSKVKCTAENITDNTLQNQVCSIVGRVYDA